MSLLEAKGADDWKSMLGGALLGRKRHAEAEPLLRDGYVRRRTVRIDPWSKYRFGEVVDRLVALAEATNKPDDVRAWKDERAKWPAAIPKPADEK